MRVTHIRETASRPGIVRVYVDNEAVGLVSLADIKELQLVAGKEIDSTTFDSVVLRAKNLEFYYRALRYADRRLRSKAEVYRYLSSKGCEAEVASSIIAKLVDAGLIDEQRLAEAFVHDTTLTKPVSKKALELKLRKKGLSDQSIAAGLQTNDLDDDKALDELIARKSKQSAYANNQARFFRYLLRQGFSFEAVAARIGKPAISGSGSRSSHRTRFN